MDQKLIFFSFLPLVLLTQFLRSQGPLDGFLKGQGNIVTAISFSHESFDRYFVGNQETTNRNLGTIGTNSANLFVAGGLTEYLDLVLTLPYISTSASEGFWSDQHNFQDISIYFKGRLYKLTAPDQSQLQLLVAGGVTTPLTDYIADAPVSIGNQSTQIEGRMIGHFKSKKGIFVTSQFGYIRRNNISLDRGFEISVPDAWDYILRTGGSLKKLYVDGWFQYQNSRTGTDIGPGVPFPSNEIDFSRVGFTLYHPLPFMNHFGISVGAAFTLKGKNIGDSNRISGALIYEFSTKKYTAQNKKQS
jgi:hypothetical protein